MLYEMCDEYKDVTNLADKHKVVVQFNMYVKNNSDDIFIFNSNIDCRIDATISLPIFQSSKCIRQSIGKDTSKYTLAVALYKRILKNPKREQEKFQKLVNIAESTTINSEEAIEYFIKEYY